MKAVVISEFGAAARLELRDIPEPELSAANDVLVRVRAAGLNRADLLQARGLYPPPAGYAPDRPGLEFSGEIVATGPAVSGVRPGDRVFGITSGESQAELLTIDQSLVSVVPTQMGLTEAAAIPEAFVTAHDASIIQAGLKSGETILIHAVGSGVGLAALQIAKAFGAITVGTSRTKAKLERCFEYGLDHGVLVDGDTDLSAAVLRATGGSGADVILDLVGGAYFRHNLASLAEKGRLLLVGLTGGAAAEFDLRVALQKRARIVGTVLRTRTLEEKAAVVAAFASDVVPLLAEGKVRANVDRVFRAPDVARAYEYLASNLSFGKVVLEF
jgi:NADPH:quinone reductase